MSWLDMALRPAPRVLRQFAGAWVLLFFVLAAQQGFWRGRSAVALGCCVLATVGVIGLVKPATMRRLFIGATALAFPIGWLVSQLTLMLMFYVVLTPLALWFRLRGRDILRRRPQPEATSHWIEKPAPDNPKRYLRQY
jgi:Saxitoxin biosynthesis operon protein SxtJ